MERLTERLRDRFAWGLTVRVQQPDLATRIVLLRRLATERAIAVPDIEVLSEIARSVPANLRRLEGALTRVAAFSSLLGEPPSAEIVERALSDDEARPAGPPSARPQPTIDEIQTATCDVLRVSRADLASPRRATNVVRARQLGDLRLPGPRPRPRSPRSPAPSAATTRPCCTRSAPSRSGSSPAPMSTARSKLSTSVSTSDRDRRDRLGLPQPAALVHTVFHRPNPFAQARSDAFASVTPLLTSTQNTGRGIRMKITADRDPLIDALQAAARALSTRSTLPSLGGILISAEGGVATARATDMELGLAVAARCPGRGRRRDPAAGPAA